RRVARPAPRSATRGCWVLDESIVVANGLELRSTSACLRDAYTIHDARRCVRDPAEPGREPNHRGLPAIHRETASQRRARERGKSCAMLWDARVTPKRARNPMPEAWLASARSTRCPRHEGCLIVARHG